MNARVRKTQAGAPAAELSQIGEILPATVVDFAAFRASKLDPERAALEAELALHPNDPFARCDILFSAISKRLDAIEAHQARRLQLAGLGRLAAPKYRR